MVNSVMALGELFTRFTTPWAFQPTVQNTSRFEHINSGASFGFCTIGDSGVCLGASRRFSRFGRLYVMERSFAEPISGRTYLRRFAAVPDNVQYLNFASRAN
eukprot:218100-Amphidinium_carterae.1